ncbi:hypothetical protein L915_19137, partial [Phytophthora nicotianae]
GYRSLSTASLSIVMSQNLFLVRDVPTALGLDVDQQLEQLAVRNEDEDEGEIDLRDDLPFLAPSSTDGEPQAAAERLIDVALNHRFPSHLEKQLRAIVRKYEIWRLKLGDVPSANVEPVRIRLREGARAVKRKPWPYPPAARAFLREFNDKLVELGWVYETQVVVGQALYCLCGCKA